MDKSNKLDQMIRRESLWHDLESQFEKERAKLDQSRQKTTEKFKRQDHWMRCPKCGGSMEEQQKGGIWIDRCLQCEGIYLDHGELELLFKAKNPGRFFELLRNWLKPESTSK